KTTHYGGIGGGGGEISLQGGQGRDAANDPSGYAPVLLQSNGGNVGLGINSPDSALHIKAGTSGTVGSHAAGQLIIQSPTNSLSANVVITAYESDANGNPDQQLWYLGSSSGSNSNITLLNRRNALLTLGTNGTTQMTILGNGNVGIGTLSPNEKLEVNGNVQFLGDLVFQGAGSGLPYGECYGDAIAWTQVAVQNTWYKVSDSDMVTDELNLMTHDGNGKLTLEKAGVYLVSYSFVWESPRANEHTEFGISVDGAGTPHMASHIRTESKFANVEQQQSHSTLITITAGQTIEGVIRTVDSGNPTLTVDDLHIVAVMIGS
ncbi:hypothetical protein LCGC14_0306400, partial [marine sediment metagenome]